MPKEPTARRKARFLEVLSHRQPDLTLVLATSFTEKARPMREWDFTRPTAVIMGNEHSGVEPELLAAADGELYIPMYGMIQSFNVSVASAIILAEAARQREAAGMYATPRFDEATLATRLGEWLEK